VSELKVTALEAVLELVNTVSTGEWVAEWVVDEWRISNPLGANVAMGMDDCDSAAIAAAVNYLRTHGPAMLADARYLEAYRKAINKIDDASEYRQISRQQITEILAELQAAPQPPPPVSQEVVEALEFLSEFSSNVETQLVCTALRNFIKGQGND